MSNDIYHGVWTNWSKGRIYGATLTLSTRDGNVLAAFLALFVTAVSSQLWRFLCYVVHQMRSTNRPHDILFYRTQVIVKNAATPLAAAWDFFIQGIHGRRVLRAMPWVTTSGIYALAFALAAIFSASISTAAGDARLIQTSTCGFWTAGLDDLRPWNTKQNDEIRTAASYARACYGEYSRNSQCMRLPTRQILYTTDTNASCPFQSGICVYGDTAAINLTTRFIDSHEHLGINAPPSHRIQYQLSKTCAPLNQSGHRDFYEVALNDTVGILGDGIYEYKYGRNLGIGSARDLDLTTWIHNNHSMYQKGGYVLSSLTSVAGMSATAWIPILALNRTDADVSIFFLEANTFVFESINNDPMFAAHISMSLSVLGQNITVYLSDRWVTTMACIEQMRFCNPGNNACSPYLGGFQAAQYLMSQNEFMLSLNRHQRAAADRIVNGIYATSIEDPINHRGAAALRAAEMFLGNTQGSLPDDQWTIEVRSWMDTSLARFQFSILDFAISPADPTYSSYYSRVDRNPDLLNMCHNQIIHDTSDTVSFSILGLTIVFSLGGLFILLNQLGEVILGHFQTSRKQSSFKRNCWKADDVLNLHSLALEAKSGSAEKLAMTSNSGTNSCYDGQHPQYLRSTEADRMSTYGKSHSSAAHSLMEEEEVMVTSYPAEAHSRAHLTSYHGKPFDYTAVRTYEANDFR